jgi:uncharacterized protein (DUF4415 family)
MTKPLTDKDGEVRELTDADFAKAEPAAKVLANIVGAEAADNLMCRGQGERGQQKSPTKQAVSIRLSPGVLAHFRATGKGWQTRIDEALKIFIKEHAEL